MHSLLEVVCDLPPASRYTHKSAARRLAYVNLGGAPVVGHICGMGGDVRTVENICVFNSIVH